MKFKILEDMKLQFAKNGEWVFVTVRPCFPESQQNAFFSVRDSEGEEVAFFKNLEGLEEASRNDVRKYLELTNFKFEITGVYKIEEDFGLRHFEVETTVGKRFFQMGLDEWPIIRNGVVTLSDLSGEKYIVTKDLKFGDDILNAYI